MRDTTVHHAVEQTTNNRYDDLIDPSQMHSPENLRGIPNDLNGELHLSAIRTAWNRFYKAFDEAGVTPTQDDLLEFATIIDDVFGHLIIPPVR